jgi:hypothetical protein
MKTDDIAPAAAPKDGVDFIAINGMRRVVRYEKIALRDLEVGDLYGLVPPLPSRVVKKTKAYLTVEEYGKTRRVSLKEFGHEIAKVERVTCNGCANFPGGFDLENLFYLRPKDDAK